MEIVISAKDILEEVVLGESIAVNGVCLTVTRFQRREWFAADVMPETMRSTNLGSLTPGEGVNLERAMTPRSRFGGHMVSGHVDGTGRIVHMESQENAMLMTVETTAELRRHMLPKGSITLDGISLTLVAVAQEGFTVSIIPHTLSQTNLQWKKPGDTVNLEVDMLSKYVRQWLDELLSNGKLEITATEKG